MALLVLSAFVGALLFGAAGFAGRIVAEWWYGSVEPAPDGPPPLAVPGWMFVVVPACIGSAVGIHGAEPARMAILVLAVLALSVCAATDARTGMLPDLFTLGPLAALLALALPHRDWLPLAGALFAFVPFAALAAASRGRGMGWGDVKLAAFGGALVGMSGMTIAVALAAGAAYALGRRRGQPQHLLAFGPYLTLAIGTVLGFGAVA